MRQVLRNNPYFFVPYAVLLVATAIVLALVPKGQVLLLINQNHTTFWDSFFQFTNYMGEGVFLGLVLVTLLFVRIKYALLLGFCLVQMAFVVQLLKRNVFNMPRPKAWFGDTVDLYFVPGVEVYTKFSFPSGHTTTAFLVFCMLALLIKQKQLGLVFLIFAVLAGLARIYLSQHFLMDVFAGSILGCTFSLVNYSLFSSRQWYQHNALLNKPVTALFKRK